MTYSLNAPSADGRKKPAGGLARQALVLAGKICAVTAVLLLLLVAGLVARIAYAPVSLGFLAPYVEHALANDGRAVRIQFSDGVVAWGHSRSGLEGPFGRFEFRLNNVEIADATAALSLPQAVVGISALGLVRGDLAPSFVELEGVRLRVDWRHGDIFAALRQDDGDDGAVIPFLAHLLEPRRPGQPGEYLRRVIIRNAELLVHEGYTGSGWAFSEATVALRRTAKDVTLEAAATLKRPGMTTARVAVSGAYEPAASETTLAIALADINPSQLAGQSEALAQLKVADMAWSGDLTLRLGENQVLKELVFDLSAGPGTLDLLTLYPAPVAVEAASVNGRYEPERQVLTLNALDLRFAGAQFSGDGLIWQDAAEGSGYGIKLVGSLSDLPFAALDTYWPPEVAPEARHWVTDNITRGKLTRGDLTVNITPEMQAAATLPAEAFDLRFAFTGITAHYLRPMPPIVRGKGVARLNPQSFVLETSAAEVSGVALTKATIAFADLHKDGETRAGVKVAFAGDVSKVLALIDHQPLGYPSAYGLKPGSVQGAATAELDLMFPLKKHLALKDVNFTLSSRLTDVTMGEIFTGVGLVSPEFNLQVNRMALQGEGTIALNAVPFRLTWSEDFTATGGLPSRFALEGRVEGAEWAVLAMPLDGLVAGPADVSLVLEGEGPTIRRGQGRFDLIGATMGFPALGWEKAAGTPSLARFRFTKPTAGTVYIDELVYEDPALKASGTLLADESDGLKQLVIDNLKVGKTHLAATVTRSPANVFAIAVTAAAFDAAPFLSDVLDGAERAYQFPDFTLDLTAGRVEALGGVTLNNLVVDASYRDGSWANSEVMGGLDNSGGSGKGGKLRFELVAPEAAPSGGKPRRSFALTATNAALVARGLGIFDNAVGGDLTFSGSLTEPGAAQIVKGEVTIDGFRVVKAPVLTRILTIGSLTGIRDLVSGDGISFERMRVPFVLADGLITLNDARAWGPAIGLSMSGELSTRSHQVALSGTVVPAYTANNVLGWVPVLGNLIMGGEGEGLFAMTYDVSGGLDNPQVSVNPLSILTPGFLRSIFGGATKLQDEQKSKPMPNSGPDNPDAPVF